MKLPAVPEPTLIRHTLKNGVELVAVPMPGRSRVHLDVQLHGGSVFEDESVWGLSHALEHMLFRGAGKYRDVDAVTAAADAFGGEIQALTYRDHISFDTRCDAERLGEACKLIGTMMTAPRFAHLAVEKAIILEELAELVTEGGKNLDADNALYQSVFAGCPLGRTIEGQRAQIKKLTRPKLQRFFQTRVSGKNTVVTAAGAVEPKAFFAAASLAFGRLPPGEVLQPAHPPKTHRRPSPLTVIKEPGPQLSVRLGFAAAGECDPQAEALWVLSRLLDDGPRSRLQSRLVDKSGLAYGVWCSLDAYVMGSLLELAGTVRPEKAGTLAKALLHELHVLADEAAPRAELNAVVCRAARDMRDVVDDPAMLASIVGRSVLIGRPFSARERLERLVAVTPARVRQVAGEIGAQNSHVVLAGVASAKTQAAVRAALFST